MSHIITAMIALTLGAGIGPERPSKPPPPPSVACDDKAPLCIDPGSPGSWEPETLASVKDRRDRSDEPGGTLHIALDQGRASIFVNGRYRGSSPFSDIALPSGRNDIVLQDGQTVLAWGILAVPAQQTVRITVKHPPISGG